MLSVRLFCYCMLFGLALCLAGCERRPVMVRYEVGGTAATVGLTYRNAMGGSEQRDVTPPWSFNLSAQTGALVEITAFNKTREGTVVCQLFVDDVLVRQAESVGAFKRVRCGALAGLTNATPNP